MPPTTRGSDSAPRSARSRSIGSGSAPAVARPARRRTARPRGSRAVRRRPARSSTALDRLADAYDAVRDEIDLAQAPTEPATDTPVESAALVHRLALLLAAGAFAGVCAERGDESITADPLVREACLRRVEDRLAGRAGALEPHLVERLVAYAVDRTDRGIRLTISTTRRCAAPGAGGRRHPMNTDAMTIEAWLEGRVVAYGKVDVGSFTPETPLAELGLDSVYALTLCGDIEDRFDLEVDPTIVWDHPTIRSLAHGISDRLAAAA